MLLADVWSVQYILILCFGNPQHGRFVPKEQIDQLSGTPLPTFDQV